MLGALLVAGALAGPPAPSQVVAAADLGAGDARVRLTGDVGAAAVGRLEGAAAIGDRFALLGAATWAPGADSPVGASALAHLTLRRDERVSVAVDGGVAIEDEGAVASIASADVTVRQGPWSATADVVVARRFVEDADPVDVRLPVAVTWSAERWAVGVVAVGRDLEDAFEDEEAEGGASAVVAPTLSAGAGHVWAEVAPGIVVAPSAVSPSARIGVAVCF